MKQYLDIVKHVLEKGKIKRPVRKNPNTGEFEPVDGGVSTLACANVCFSHDMSEGFPLLTTKKMAWKSLRVELEGFIRGITDKKWYQERGCRIWNEWANPQAVENEVCRRWMEYCTAHTDEELPEQPPWEFRKQIMQELTDLGPIYGYQWRHFGQQFPGLPDPLMTKGMGLLGAFQAWYKPQDFNGVVKGFDQLKYIVDTLRKNPTDRRMVCSAWNPNQLGLMALPPCHWGWNVTVIGDELNLSWAQRS